VHRSEVEDLSIWAGQTGSMADLDDGARSQPGPEVRAQDGDGLGIEVAGRLVEQEYGTVEQHRPCQAETLSLTRADGASGLAQDAIEAVEPIVDQAVETDETEDLGDLSISGGAAKQEVLAQAGGEDMRSLRNQSYLLMPPGRVNLVE